MLGRIFTNVQQLSIAKRLFLSYKVASSVTDLAAPARCRYENKIYRFTCDEPTGDTDSEFCIFHDRCYLKGDNYEKHTEKISRRFEERVSEYLSKNKSLKFIGYCLPDISFPNKQFAEALYFNDATFYGEANFREAMFSKEAYFHKATFSEKADFSRATFSEKADFYKAGFLSHKAIAEFRSAEFHGEAIFWSAEFSGKAYFWHTNFYRNAGFWSAKFFGDAEFRSAKFSEKANFYGVEFSEETRFLHTEFHGEAEFEQAKFSKSADFSNSKFLNEAHFSEGERESQIFNGETLFNYTIFEQPNKVIFDAKDLSKVSFADSDITRVRFTDKVHWGSDNTVIEENSLVEEVESQKKDNLKNKPIESRTNKARTVSPELVLSVYRNLRENYEFRLRYGDAGKFFIKEMDLKRKYREAPSMSAFERKLTKVFRLKHANIYTPQPKIENVVKENGYLRKHFSLTGLYYHFSDYGESIVKPTLIGVITLTLSTLFWLTQKDPTKDPSFSKFVGAYWILINHNSNYLERAFERSLADFLPLLSLPSNIQVGVIDYVIKIVGGALTFGLLIIALRRKFERKYTR